MCHDSLVDEHLVADRRVAQEIGGWNGQEVAFQFQVAGDPVRSHISRIDAVLDASEVLGEVFGQVIELQEWHGGAEVPG